MLPDNSLEVQQLGMRAQMEEPVEELGVQRGLEADL